VALAARAPLSRDLEAQPIIRGSTDANTHGVVLILITKPMRTPFTWCIGVVVSPHVVLTAAHCVDPTELDTGSTLSIFTGDTFVYGNAVPEAQSFAIKETHLVDGFSLATASTEGRDLGVAITDAPIPVTPVDLYAASAVASNARS
jgi:V8-like Glu-specific endopeptidase